MLTIVPPVVGERHDIPAGVSLVEVGLPCPSHGEDAGGAVGVACDEGSGLVGFGDDIGPSVVEVGGRPLPSVRLVRLFR